MYFRHNQHELNCQELIFPSPGDPLKKTSMNPLKESSLMVRSSGRWITHSLVVVFSHYIQYAQDLWSFFADSAVLWWCFCQSRPITPNFFLLLVHAQLHIIWREKTSSVCCISVVARSCFSNTENTKILWLYYNQSVNIFTVTNIHEKQKMYWFYRSTTPTRWLLHQHVDYSTTYTSVCALYIFHYIQCAH